MHKRNIIDRCLSVCLYITIYSTVPKRLNLSSKNPERSSILTLGIITKFRRDHPEQGP